MKRMFKYLLAFESEDGSKTVAEFNSHEECQAFKKDLDEKGLSNQLVNERESQALQYKGASYLDMKD